ncbi:peptidoglycan DD-metalloendopeptidase family protein [Streptomyces sp. 3MP-14]|uniref:Peptidoglycan DD-metalloendopeptidase family protein n=1 Tax=Streptomyces mimosae TaxID=2586635 RepID=A0A5N6ANQ5_9ACTN|nr:MULTISPECIES: M23 family metallopeptidase [Streptomyces]KAB8169686.1 peptidoglycan DD-metalloendopeptidase family protein [Streptomyces mimosae]KAB8178434.1 peptidoglycan DD-metalloendopeptidase family protein [Streptomyces sp. 3MP-14]
MGTGRHAFVAILTRRLARPLAGLRPSRPSGRWAAGCTLLGAVAIAGPWAVTAIGQEDEGPAARTGEIRQFLGGIGDAAIGAHRGLGPYYGPLAEQGWNEPFQPWYWHPTAGPEWALPVTGYPVSARYGIPGGWAAGYHTGVDFAAPVGTPVHSVGPGRVIETGYSGDYGNAVTVAMDDGHFTLYAHLDSIAVEPGQSVTAESWLGDSGNTGRSTGPHLHFEVRTSNVYGSDIDPLSYLVGHGVEIG